MNTKPAGDKSYSGKNLSELLDYAQYVFENSRSLTAEARELRAKLKLDDSNAERSGG